MQAENSKAGVDDATQSNGKAGKKKPVAKKQSPQTENPTTNEASAAQPKPEAERQKPMPPKKPGKNELPATTGPINGDVYATVDKPKPTVKPISSKKADSSDETS